MRVLRRYLEAARVPTPVTRRLRAFAFDPSLGAQIRVSVVQRDHARSGLGAARARPGRRVPRSGRRRPGQRRLLPPGRPRRPHLLAQDGLAPSESNPQFHQQMVYAVAMTTIQHFERALGRVALWADRRVQDGKKATREQFVRRLRIYPHALRDRNAYYSPVEEGAALRLLPGHREGSPTTRRARSSSPACRTTSSRTRPRTPCSTACTRASTSPPIPTCWPSTRRSPTSSRCSSTSRYPDVLAEPDRRTRGDLDSENLLGQLAQQFGRPPAAARRCATRSAARTRPPARGSRARPIRRRSTTTSARTPAAPSWWRRSSARSSLIYRARTADLFRIATQGTGMLPDGEIHPDLTSRLAQEAARCADRVLQMCIRAIDYCPPVDITFGGIPARHHHRRPRLHARGTRELPPRLRRELPRVGHLPARHLEHGRRRAGLADGRGADAAS